MAKQDMTNKYLLFIVGIVAVVGIVILILNTSSVSLVSDEDYVGTCESTGYPREPIGECDDCP